MASPVTRSSFSGVEFPRSGGGILLNGEAPVATPTTPASSGFSMRGRPAAITIVRPDSPSPTETSPPTTAMTPPQNSAELSASPRIRFAPLPDPHRPRSLSTGRNIGFRGSDGPNGEREYSLELRNMESDEHAVGSSADDDDDDGNDDGDDNDSDEGGGYDAHGRRRSWVTMGMNMGSMGSWMGKSSSKKASKKEDTTEFGAPLKKSVSSGMIPTPSTIKDKLTPDLGLKKGASSLGSSLLGTSPGSSLLGGSRGSISGGSSHRRAGSGDASGSLGTSAPKVRMLNGRVYGARRASEAAAAEEMRRRKMEPEFVEWGSGQKGGVGSNFVPNRKRDDDDDGGGMAWVRKRREERQRREQEEKERREREQAENGDGGETGSDAEGRPASLSSSASSSSGARGVANGPLTPSEPPAELVAYPPAIQIVPPGQTATPSADTSKTLTPVGTENNHIVQAIAIPGGGGAGMPRGKARRKGSDDYDDDDDDGDFDDDDDDEDDMDAVGASRFTSSAAGVEILSRHKAS